MLGSASRTATGTGSISTRSIASASRAGTSSPIGERPSTTEPSRPTAANASVGASTHSQASSTARAASPEREGVAVEADERVAPDGDEPADDARDAQGGDHEQR